MGAPWSLGGGTVWDSKILLSLIPKELWDYMAVRQHYQKHIFPVTKKQVLCCLCAALDSARGRGHSQGKGMKSLRAAKRMQTLTSNKFH